MSRVWVKLYTEMLHDPKVGQLSDGAYRLFVELILIAGKVDLEGVTDTPENIAWELRKDLDTLNELLDELLDTGLVIGDPNHFIIVKSFKKRQPETTVNERVKRHREKKKEEAKQGGNVTSNSDVTLQVTDEKRSSNVLEKKREEKRRKEKTPPKSPPRGKGAAPISVIFPKNLATDEFRELWTRWERHRREIKKPLKPTMVESQIKKLSEWGHDRAVAALEHTISQGWQGIREPERSYTNGTGPPRNRATEEQAARKAANSIKALLAGGES